MGGLQEFGADLRGQDGRTDGPNADRPSIGLSRSGDARRSGGGPNNREQLQTYVESCLQSAASAPDPRAHLRRNAAKLDGFLWTLSAAAAADRDPPPHLEGLTAFDLVDAAERLLAAAEGAQA